MILVVLVFVTADQVAGIVGGLAAASGPLRLDGSDIYTDMKFLIPGINGHGWFDDVRNAKRLRASMAETHELVVARVKDDTVPSTRTACVHACKKSTSASFDRYCITLLVGGEGSVEPDPLCAVVSYRS